MRWLALLVAACTPPVVPGGIQPCGSVPISAELDVTAGHCPELAEVVTRVPGADLMLVRQGAKRWARLRVEPAAQGTRATLRGLPFEVVDPLLWSDGHAFLRAWPELEPGHSGSGLWAGGELLGVAIGNDGQFAVFAHALEVSAALEATK